jgi:hypothetical protein
VSLELRGRDGISIRNPLTFVERVRNTGDAVDDGDEAR